MSFLCISHQANGNLDGFQVNTQAECIGYIAPLADPTITGLSISDANQLLGATALLFVTAFIFRAVLKHIGVT